MDVPLRLEVDPEARERCLEGGEHLLAGEAGVPFAGAEEARDVPALRLLERDPDSPPEECVHGAHVHVLGVRRGSARTGGELFEREAEARVELAVGGRAELARRGPSYLGDAHVALVQVLRGQRDAGAVEPLAPVAVGLVGDRGAQEPVADLLAVHRGRERRLEPRDLLGVRPGQVSQIALAAEAPELAGAATLDLGRRGEAPAGIERRQVREALVDRGELELVLLAREMEVVLLVERGDEPVGFVPVRLELCPGPSPWVA